MTSYCTSALGEIPRTDLPIVIDGKLDDPAWSAAVQIPVNIETHPGENIPAKVPTVAYLLEDGANLYVGFDATDPDPNAIRAYLRDRDAAFNDDIVGIVIDTFGDQQHAFEFLVNPLGVQMDLTVDGLSGKEDDSWDAIWDSAGRIHETGFVVEMKIPLNQIRFPKVEGLQAWGIDLLRFYPREFRYRLASTPQDRNLNCYLCQLPLLQGLPDVDPGRDLELVPTITASQTSNTDEPGILPLNSQGTDVDAGLSVRWGITPDITANLAINPDFSQVESDNAKLDVNNQFALFFPEKRPFFLDGASYFSTPVNAVFTRTVSDPTLGAKLTGKRGKNTYGVFVAEDEVTNLVFPGAFGSDSDSLRQENTVVVGRYSRSFADASTIGVLATSRSGDDYHNHLGGADLRWKASDQHSVQMQYLQSETLYPESISSEFEQATGEFSGHAAVLKYDYDSRNWFAYANHEDRSAGFRADSGFVPQVDFNQQEIGGGHKWIGEDDDWHSEIELRGNWEIMHDDAGRLLERAIKTQASVNGPMQSYVRVAGLARKRLYDDILFEEENFTFYGEFQPASGIKSGLWGRIGTQIDFANTRLGDQVRLEPFLDWNVNRHLLLRYGGVFSRLDTREGPNIFDAAIHDLRLTWQFSVRSFLRLTAQVMDIRRNPEVYEESVDQHTQEVGRQLLYSYKLNPQTVFFLGYADALINDDALDRLESYDQTWFLKVGYAWNP